MPDKPPLAPPPLSDIALRETLDLLGQVIASMSARIDKQGEVVAGMSEKLDAQATHQSQATVTFIDGLDAILNDVEATRTQTDPAGYARFIGTEVEKALDGVLDEFAGAIRAIRKDHETTAARLKELEQAEEAALERLRREMDAAARWRRRVPWVWAGAVSTALALAAVLNGLF